MNKKFLSIFIMILLLFTTLSILTTQANTQTEQILNEIQKIQDKNLKIDRTIGDKQVTYYEHYINNIQIKNDSILIHKNKDNGEIIKYEKNWDASYIEQKININQDFSKIQIENYYWKQKTIFLEEKDLMNFYEFTEPVTYPVLCLEVRHKDGRTILYDYLGEKIGYGVPAPADGFLMTGPHEGNDIWDYLRNNAQGYYSKWCQHITSVFNPYPSTELSPEVSDPANEFFFEVAHGGSSYFKAHTSAYYYSSDTEDDMADRQPMKFAFIGSCGGMDQTHDGTFSYEFRKGQMVNTVTVGYTGMSGDDGWPKARPWQDHMFNMMDQGYTIKESFDSASAEYPTIADAVKFVGDETLTVTDGGNLPPYAPENPIPAEDAYNIPVDAVLSWDGGDPNQDDTVYYDVYLEANNPEPSVKVSNEQTSTSYQGIDLNYETDYYWKIIARDSENAITEGPVWHFKTVDNINNDVDQRQDQSDSSVPMYESTGSMASSCYAQSFKPGKTVLSSVEIFMSKAGNPQTITLSIRSSLDGSDLVSISKSGSSISSSLEWNIFDFQDINVDIGSTYYIVVYCDGTDSSNRFYLSIGLNTDYTDGMLFRAKSIDGPWDDGTLSNDLSFRTYSAGGSDNDPPEIPVDPSPSDGEILNKPSFEEADVNGDGEVNILDVQRVGQHLGETGSPGWIPEDVDDDGEIDRIDYDLIYWHLLGSDGPPVDHEIFVSDPDGDSLTVGFYWSDGTLIEQVDNVASGTVATGGLSSSLSPGSYSWYVEVDDGVNNPVQSSVYSYTINSPDDNDPPLIPVDLSPVDDAVGVSTDKVLSWQGGDPDGDSVVYDVYLDTDENLGLNDRVANDQTGLSYDHGGFEENTEYFWKVIATDEHGESSESSIFSFTTLGSVGKDYSINFESFQNDRIEVQIENDGGIDLSNMEYNLTVEGLIFHKVDYSKEGIINSLNVGENISINTSAMNGFDIIKLTVEITVDGETRVEERLGIIILGFIFLFA